MYKLWISGLWQRIVGLISGLWQRIFWLISGLWQRLVLPEKGLSQWNIPVGAFGPSGGFGLDETRRALYRGLAN